MRCDGTLDTGRVVGVDGGEGAKKLAADKSEDRSAAGRDVVGGQQLEDGTEGEIDALGGLKVVRVGEEGLAEVQAVGLDELFGVRTTERLAWRDERHSAPPA